MFDDKVSPSLTRKHSAFNGCIWHGDSDTELLNHLLHAHEHLLLPAAESLPRCYTQEDRVLAVYNEAIAEKIRQGAPLASYAIDRRAIKNFASATEEDKILAPICVLCACVYPYKERPPAHLKIGQMTSENHIKWERPLMQENRFFTLDSMEGLKYRKSTRLHMPRIHHHPRCQRGSYDHNVLPRRR